MLCGHSKHYYKEKGCAGEMGEKEKQNGLYSVKKEGAGDAGGGEEQSNVSNLGCPLSPWRCPGLYCH